MRPSSRNAIEMLAVDGHVESIQRDFGLKGLTLEIKPLKKTNRV